MPNTLSREQKAAEAYAKFDRTDPFAYSRTLQQLQRGNCSMGSPEEVLKDCNKRRGG